MQLALVEAETTLRVGEAVVLAFAFQARVARSFAVPDPAKEGLKGKVNAAGDVLQDLAVYVGEFRVVRLPGRDSAALVNAAGRLAVRLVKHRPFMHKAVVDIAADAKCPFQGGDLRLRRVEPVAVGEV